MKKGVSNTTIIIIVVIIILVIAGIFFLTQNKDEEIDQSSNVSSEENNAQSSVNNECFDSLSLKDIPESFSEFSKVSIIEDTDKIIDLPSGKKQGKYGFVSQYSNGEKIFTALVYYLNEEKSNIDSKESIINQLKDLKVSYNEEEINGFNFITYEINGIVLHFGTMNNAGISIGYNKVPKADAKIITQEYLNELCN